MAELVVGLTIGAVYGLIAIGFSLTYRSIGLLNFSHPEFMMVGAMIGVSMSKFSLPLVVLLIMAAAGGALVAFLVDVSSIQWISRRSGMGGSNGIIATLGWSSLLAGVALLVWGPDPLAYKAPAHVWWAKLVNIAGAAISVENLLIFGAALVLMLLFQWLLTRTRLGMGLRAAADDRDAAAMCGISLASMERWTFALSGALGGLAGLFVGMLFTASYDLGSFGLAAFAPAVLGGFGDVMGAIVGGLAFGIILTYSATWLGNGYQDVVAYTLVLVVLLIRPTGLLGKRRRTA